MKTNTNIENETIYFEQLIAGLLLKFKRVNNLTLKIIGEDIGKKKNVSFNYRDTSIKQYINETSIEHSVKQEYLDKDGNLCLEVRNILDSYTDKFVKDYLDNIELVDLIIKKVADLEILTPADVLNQSEIEQACIREMIDAGYLINLLSENTTGKYVEVVLSKLGKKRAFELIFPDCVVEFRKLISSSGYDVSLVDEFMIEQDFSKGIYEILNLDSFLSYCDNAGKIPVANGVSGLEYKRIDYKKGKGFTKEGQELFSDMLSVIDDCHCIHICHPNHLFNTKYLIGTSLEIDRVNWEDLDIDRMKEIGDYKTFIMSDVKEAFRYVHKRLGHQIMKKIELGQEEQSYLVVVEQYFLDNEENYLVRGIIKGDKSGYSMAFNPEYRKTIATNIWERSIRFSGNEVPSVYLVKRPSKPSNKN